MAPKDRDLGVVVFASLMIACEAAIPMEASLLYLIGALLFSTLLVGLFRWRHAADDSNLDRAITILDTFGGAALLTALTFGPVSMIVDFAVPVRYDMASGMAFALIIIVCIATVVPDLVLRAVAYLLRSSSRRQT